MIKFNNFKDTIKEILSFGGKNGNEYTLIEYQKMGTTEWNVAHWYDPETRSWSAGNYAYSLDAALAICLEKMNSEYVKTDCQIRTERNYGITYDRMSELATLFKDALIEDDIDGAVEYFRECDMDATEMEYFGIGVDEEDWYENM